MANRTFHANHWGLQAATLAVILVIVARLVWVMLRNI